MQARGTHVDRYELEALIGMGGMAEVWIGRHRVLGVRRALKFILSDAGPSAAIGDALVREGQLQARLDHPNVLAVLDVLHHQAHPVLVLPLVQGPPMSALLKERPPSMAEGGALMLGVLKGVQAAHAAGVVHRDLKPGNVLLAVRHGRVVPRVADFGIAGAAKGMGWAAGTPPYAPPEQFDGRIVDVEADFFAIGVMLREVLTGSATGDLAGLPSGLRDLIVSLLCPDPTARCADVGAVRLQLEAVADPDALGLGSPIAQWVGQRAWAAPVAGATLAAEATSATFPGVSTGITLAQAAHLPRFRDAFVGRVALLRQATAQLASSTGLVTLVGPGGVGKTRVAVELADQVSRAYPGGTWFIDWSEAADGEGAALTMAQALGLQLSGADLRGDRLIDAIGEGIGSRRPSLLVVDNVEQLGGVCQQLIGRWLTLAPEARFLVTSREAVGLRGESRVEVLPLEGPT
ncbi:MAG: protein kinase, partial [Myxococcota bacterium]